eukprot:UN20937
MFTLKMIALFVVVVGGLYMLFVYQGKIRRALGIKRTPKAVDEKTMQGYRTRLRKFYEKHYPDKIDEVEETLAKWKGKEKNYLNNCITNTSNLKRRRETKKRGREKYDA